MDIKRFTTWLLAIFALLIVTLPASKTPVEKRENRSEKIEDILSDIKKSPPKPVYSEIGKATYYDYNVVGRKRTLTAAHKFLPRGTILKVEAIGPEALEYRTIEVEINDNLPDIPANEETVIDLTKKAAIAMNPKFVSRGKIAVRLTEVKE